MRIKSFKIYTDDTDENKVFVGNNIETALEILENNGYIVEVEYEDDELAPDGGGQYRYPNQYIDDNNSYEEEK